MVDANSENGGSAARGKGGLTFGRIAALAVLLAVSILIVAVHFSRTGVYTNVELNFRYLLLAMTNFDSSQKHLPPPIHVDKNNKPLCSWRYRLIPYLDSSSLEYRPSAPWDSPENSDYAETAHPCFCFSNPWDQDHDFRQACIFAVTGPGTAFDADARHGFEDLEPDVILLVEVKNSGVHWMKPGDLDIRALPESAESAKDIGIGGNDHDGFYVGFADGEVWCLRNETPLSDLKKFFTVKGGKQWDRRAVLEKYLLRPVMNLQGKIQSIGK